MVIESKFHGITHGIQDQHYVIWVCLKMGVNSHNSWHSNREIEVLNNELGDFRIFANSSDKPRKPHGIGENWKATNKNHPKTSKYIKYIQILYLL